MATSQTAFRTPPTLSSKRSPVSRAQVESVISRAVAIFGALFGIQTIPAVVSQWGEANLVWQVVLTTAVYASLAFGLIASLLQRWVRLSQSLVAIIYLIALQTWPLAVIEPTDATGQTYWLYYLLTVSTAAAAIGFNTIIATTYLLVVPAIYGLVCLTPSGGSAHWETALLDSVYSIILGGTIMVIVTMLRHAAASVDEAQSTALERYSHAVRQHATEVERVQVDSIVHDSVLTTLLSAARAYTPEAKELAATMAGNAIGHLREAALVVPDDGSTVRLTSVARRITDAANSIGARFELRTRNIGSRSIPLLAGEAVYSASVQAMVNSLQHAGPDQQVSRWLTIRGLAPAGIEIEVGDTGHGFEIPEVPRERLGLRISIVERIANAGGAADIDSALGEGTVVTIRWPATPAEGGDDS
jgi:signal transduction histidine kinase